MGEIADQILDGEICQYCGTFLGEPEGFPRTCNACARDPDTKPGLPSPKVPCPICKKRVKASGLKDHQRDVHKT